MSNEQKKFRIEEENQVILLRSDIRRWIAECNHRNWKELKQRIKKLRDIRTRHQAIDNHWHKEVLNLREVQTAVVDTANMLVNVSQVQNLEDEASQVHRVCVPSPGHFFSSGSPVQTHIFAIFKN